MTILEDLLDDLRHLEGFFVPPATNVQLSLTREQVTALITTLEAVFAVKRAIRRVE